MPVTTSRAPRALISALVVLAVGVSGCGAGKDEAPSSPEESRKPAATSDRNPERSSKSAWGTTVAPALNAFHQASSVTIGLTARHNGQRMRAKVRTGRDGECRAELVYAGKGTVRVMRTPDRAVYLAMDEAQIRAGALSGRSPRSIEADVDRFADRWVKGVPSAPSVKSITWMCDFRENIPKPSDEAMDTPVPERVTENGRRLLAFTTSTEMGTIGLSVTEGKPELYAFEMTGNRSPFRAVFTAYGKPVGAFHPPAGDVLTPEGLPAAKRTPATGT
ncbi:hypothetical protein ABT354_13310 [Streptomyces sp. NPDC000594]|uniref:hypothetical protein n=1 Tax=Streptomyces sp. NPDC000594 TaxID=3154261 RepID=UPI0033252E0D